MTVAGLIIKQRWDNLQEWKRCLAIKWKDNNPHLNMEKTKEIVVNLRREYAQHPQSINGAAAERVSSALFMGGYTTSLAKKAQQPL